MHSLVKLIKKTYRMARPHERRIVLDNVASLSALQAITYILPIITIPYLFRVIGPEKFGLIAFAQAFIQYFMIITDYGFGVTATKEISICRNTRVKVCRIFSAVMTAKLLLASLSFLILVAIVYFIPKFRNDAMVYLISFGTVIGNTLFPVWFFQGTERMKHIANLNIFGGFIITFFIFIFVNSPQDYLLVPIVYSAVTIITGISGQYIAFRKFGLRFKLQGYNKVRQQFKAGWDVFISIAAINAYTTTRIFTVGLLTNNTVTGFYSIAEKISNIFQTFPLTSFTQAIFPRLSHMFNRNKFKALEVMQKLQQITTSITLIVFPLVFVSAHLMVKIACGQDYQNTALTLKLLLISILFINANAFRIQFLLVSGKTRIYSKIHITMAMVGMPLIILFIYAFSYVGAAIATVVIEAGIFTITYLTLKKFKFS